MYTGEFTTGSVVAARYRLREQLGAGGMGEVWVAEHMELGKVVALKLMLASMGAQLEMRNRFLNEARAAASIEHPNIVDVFDLGYHGESAFIAMEKLEGEDLEHRIVRQGPLPLEEAIRIGLELADAVGAAHERGVIHRDLKPANVFLNTRGRQRDVVKVLDFGIAKLTQASSDVQTKTGAVFGSPHYMAPEQLADSKAVDARTDIYALGGIMYAMLTGGPAFDSPTLPELFFRVVSSSPDPVRGKRPDVPEWLERLTLAALAKRPEQRPQSAGSFAALLESRGGELAPVPDPAAPTTAPFEPGVTAAPAANSAAALTPLYSTNPPALRSGRTRTSVALAVAATVAVLAVGVGVVVVGARAATGSAGDAVLASAGLPSAEPATGLHDADAPSSRPTPQTGPAEDAAVNPPPEAPSNSTPSQARAPRPAPPSPKVNPTKRRNNPPPGGPPPLVPQ